MIQILLNTIVVCFSYSLIACGFSIVYSTTRFIHFTQGIAFTLSPYCAYLLTSKVGLPVIYSILLAVLFTTIVGMLIEVLAYRPLRRKGSSLLMLLLSSLGIYIILQNLISLIFGDDTKSLRTGDVSVGMEFLGARITTVQVVIIVTSIFLLLSCWALMKYTRIGATMRAVAANPELAFVTGIDTDKVILFTFAIGSALAGIAGILISFDTDMTPTMGMNALMMGVVAIIIGGVGSIPGAALGAFLLAFAQNFGVWKISSQWQDAIAFIVLLLFLLLRPQGFFGKKIRKAEV